MGLLTLVVSRNVLMPGGYQRNANPLPTFGNAASQTRLAFRLDCAQRLQGWSEEASASFEVCSMSHDRRPGQTCLHKDSMQLVFD